MKKLILLIGFSLTISTFECLGQSYEKVYELSSAEVQTKMNENKISGIDILSGIKTTHIIGISGIGLSRKDDFKKHLDKETHFLSYILSEDATSLILETQATYTKEDINQLVSLLNGQITGYTAEYSLYKQ